MKYRGGQSYRRDGTVQYTYSKTAPGDGGAIYFYPTAFKDCAGIAFTHTVVGGQRKKGCIS